MRQFSLLALFILLLSGWSFGGGELGLQRGVSDLSTRWRYEPRVGQVHVHSALSAPIRGSDRDVFQPTEYDHALAGTPEKLCALAAKKKFDFLIFHDHAENLSPAMWQELQGCEGAHHDGSLVALAGYEWTDGGVFQKDYQVAHLGVVGTPRLLGKRSYRSGWQGTVISELPALYASLDALTDNWFGVFCHPWSGASHFAQFRISTDLRRFRERMVAIEVGGGEGPERQYNFSEGEKHFVQALAQGLRVAPVYGLDNFDSRMVPAEATVAWVSPGAWSRASLFEALFARRVFARCYTKPILVKFFATSTTDRQPMGGVLALAPDQEIRFEIELDVAHQIGPAAVLCALTKSQGVMTYPLPTKQFGRRIQTSQGEHFFYEYQLSGRVLSDVIAYYVRVVTGKTVVGLTAPIWIQEQSVSEKSSAHSPESTMGTGITIRVEPGQRRVVTVARGNSEWHQACRISLGGQPIFTHQFFANNEVRQVELVNTTSQPQSYLFELFHSRNGSWERTTKFRSKTVENATRLIWFEDGFDEDYDDFYIRGSLQ